jgi:hypothetical protein
LFIYNDSRVAVMPKVQIVIHIFTLLSTPWISTVTLMHETVSVRGKRGDDNINYQADFPGISRAQYKHIIRKRNTVIR